MTVHIEGSFQDLRFLFASLSTLSFRKALLLANSHDAGGSDKPQVDMTAPAHRGRRSGCCPSYVEESVDSD